MITLTSRMLRRRTMAKIENIYDNYNAKCPNCGANPVVGDEKKSSQITEKRFTKNIGYLCRNS